MRFLYGGAVEAAACVLALCNQVLPPTINHEHPDPECDPDVAPHVPRTAALTQVLSNSFGFGGQKESQTARSAETTPSEKTPCSARPRS